MQRKENIIIWVFFSIVFIGANMALSRQSESIATNSYLISAFLALSLTFILDRFLKKGQSQEKENSSHDKTGNNKKDSISTSPPNQNQNQNQKRKKQQKHSTKT